ncbi:MAG: DUF4350 domain-containing protein [Planctomyces sp.]
MKKKRRLQRSDRIWAGAALLLVLLQFWWLPGEDGSAADSYSTTVDGKLALYRLASRLFPRVEREAQRMLPEENCVLLVLGPDVYPTKQQQTELAGWVRGGGCLVFAPNLRQPHLELRELGISIGAFQGAVSDDGSALAVEATEDLGQLRKLNEAQKQAQQRSTPSVSPPVPALGAEQLDRSADIRSVPVSVNNELSGGAVTFRTRSSVNAPSGLKSQSLVTAAVFGDQVLEVQVGYGRVLVCASPDLFSNRTLLDTAAQRLAVRLLERARMRIPNDGQEYWQPEFNTNRIELSEYFNAADSYRSTGVLLSPAMRIGTLQLLLVAILSIWLAFHRFGPTLAAQVAPRRSLTESAEAIGNLQYRLPDGGPLVGSYLGYLQGLLRKRFGAQLRLDDAAALARRTGLDVDLIRTELGRAMKLAGQPRTTIAAAASMVRWLCRLQSRL